MKTAEQLRRESVRRYEENRQYAGNAATDQRIDFALNMSDEDILKIHEDCERKAKREYEAYQSKKAKISAERKATGKSKKAYREEYDRLMKDYKSTGNIESYKAAKSIAKYAF